MFQSPLFFQAALSDGLALYADSTIWENMIYMIVRFFPSIEEANTSCCIVSSYQHHPPTPGTRRITSMLSRWITAKWKLLKIGGFCRLGNPWQSATTTTTTTATVARTTTKKSSTNSVTLVWFFQSCWSLNIFDGFLQDNANKGQIK